MHLLQSLKGNFITVIGFVALGHLRCHAKKMAKDNKANLGYKIPFKFVVCSKQIFICLDNWFLYK